jgi:peptide/nickel transport system substrate-binding protein
LLLAAVLVLAAAASAEPSRQGRYGGVLVVAQTIAPPDTLDPATAGSPGSDEIFDAICERMYTTDEQLNFVPQLATSMPTISPDKLTYTIQLRQGIVFNDGTPFNAQAVVTSYERYMSIQAATYPWSYIASITASGPYTVVFHLTSRFSPLLQVLMRPIMSPTQLQKLGTNFGSDPVCVGPFMYDSQVPGVSVTVIKSPYYYDKYAVHLDKIVFLNVPDTATAAADLEAGDVQLVDSLGPGDIAAVQGTKGLGVIEHDTIGYESVTINIGNKTGFTNPYATVNTPLAQSPKLRQAFEEAIDRNALAKVLFPTAQPGCTMIAPASSYYDPTVKCTPYDPAAARKLVAASGITNPTVTLNVRSATVPLLIAQFVQAEEAAVGINVVLNIIGDATTYRAQAYAGNFDAAIFGNSFTVDPSTGMLSLVGTGGNGNKSGFSNPPLDLDLANYVKSTSARSHKVLLHSAEEILVNERPIIILYHPIAFIGYNTSLTGVQADANVLPYRIAFAQYS